MAIKATIHIDDDEVRQQIKELNSGIENVLNESVNETLDVIEGKHDLAGGQIGVYTQTSKPNKPVGSDYRRTFRLKRSSKRRRPNQFSGEWYTDGSAPYDEFVIGPKVQQADIHQNRWTPLEEIEELAAQALPQIINEKLEEL